MTAENWTLGVYITCPQRMDRVNTVHLVIVLVPTTEKAGMLKNPLNSSQSSNGTPTPVKHHIALIQLIYI